MVHSGSASPMKTTPSVSPHLTVPAPAPPLHAAPLVPPPTTDQEVTHTLAKFHTTEIISISDLTQPSTPTPADVEPPGVTQTEALSTQSGPASSSTETLTPTQGSLNGRTSGRKRTPKACDCCGPNSKGHNVRTSGRGKGRGRGRGRGSDLCGTPKRKVDGLLTRINSVDLTMEEEEEAEEEEDGQEKVQTEAVADARTQAPVEVSQQDGPMTDSAAPETEDVQKKEDMSIEGSVVAGAGRCDDKGVEFVLSDMASRVAAAAACTGRARRGKGRAGATSATNMEIKCGFKRGGFGGGGGGGFMIPKTFALPRMVHLQNKGPNKVPEMNLGMQPDLSSLKSPLGNGDTVNLSDSEPEDQAKEDGVMIEMVNGLSSSLLQSGSPQDLDSDMQVDQSQADSWCAPTCLSNGNSSAPSHEDRCSALMETKTCHPAAAAAPPGPIAVSSVQHRGALKDHRLYCHPGTWDQEEMEGALVKGGGETDGRMQDEEEMLEQLTDLIHEFMESFYMKYGGFIPLSETDVLEYLKKKGNCDLSNRDLDIKREMRRYRAGLASAPIAGFMVTYNKHNLSLEDLSTLEEQNWLNDQIINMYGELIMEATQQKVHFFNSFFHKQLVAKGYEGVKRWTKKVDLFSKWLLLIPIHLEIHWSLITVTMATKTISYYDSQGIVFRHTTDNIMKYLLSEARERKQTAFQKGWKITIIKGIPQQKNDSDCGVFVLEYCRCLSVKQPLQFSQDDMPRIRKRIYKELCDCRLND